MINPASLLKTFGVEPKNDGSGAFILSLLEELMADYVLKASLKRGPSRRYLDMMSERGYDEAGARAFWDYVLSEAITRTEENV